MAKLKSEIEEMLWLEFVKWAKKNPITTLSYPSNYLSSRPLTLQEFWYWYQEEKL